VAVESAIAELSPAVSSFLSATPPRYATIATTNPDGSPHQIVIWYLARDGQLVVNSRHGRRWPANLRREQRANVCVYEGEDAVTLECDLERVYEGEPAQADIAEMAIRYGSGANPRFRTERRVSFVLRPRRVHVHGDPH
jgi:hypothetical protein